MFLSFINVHRYDFKRNFISHIYRTPILHTSNLNNSEKITVVTRNFPQEHNFYVILLFTPSGELTLFCLVEGVYCGELIYFQVAPYISGEQWCQVWNCVNKFSWILRIEDDLYNGKYFLLMYNVFPVTLKIKFSFRLFFFVLCLHILVISMLVNPRILQFVPPPATP